MLLTKKVKVKRHGNNRKHFEKLGYNWTKRGDKFEIPVEYLTSGSGVRIDVRCDYCGEVYMPTWQNFLEGRKVIEKDACKNRTCRAMKKAEIRDGFYTTVADVPNLLKEWSPKNNVDPSRVLTGSDVKYKWVCSVDDSHTWEASVKNRTRGRNCPHCANYFRYNEPLSVTHNHLVAEWCKSNDKNPDEITAGSVYRAKWKCSTCSHEWEATVCNRTSSRTNCPSCRDSKGEKLVASLLESLGVDFSREVEFPNGKLIGERDGFLRYDFGILLNGQLIALIEYDGGQHFKPIEHFGGQEGYERLVRHDTLKDEYAELNDLSLLRIRYDLPETEIKRQVTEFVESCISFESLLNNVKVYG